MNKFKQLLSEIIKDKNHWSDLKTELSKYNIDNREDGIKDTSAGKIFEVFAKYYFLTAPEVDGLYSEVWLYDEIPLIIKENLDLGTVEHGIDLLLKTTSEEFIAVQCKFKNDETSKLNWSSDKISNLFGYCPKADGYIVFSNCSALDKVSLSRQENFTFYSIFHLLEIESNVFANISLFINDNKPKEKVFFKPKPHQKKAIEQCVEWFTEREKSRGQLILPCGAGKTLTALWIKEELKSQKTLVLVPSLGLLRQIKNEWSKQQKTKYHYICVCSEKDIDKDNSDTAVTHTYEIGGNVTTSSSKILSFLSHDLTEKVIFSTYQSLPRIIEAIKNTKICFDFIFCDEAHKTAGVNKGVFGLVHDNQKIPAKKRLYATATPRIVKESLKKKLGDDLKYTHDMNDPETYGKEFYRMSFKDAISEDILVDYKIIAIGVNNVELSNYIKERRFIGDNLSIDEIANNYALENVMNKYSANHGLTFHSRVKLAKEFAFRHSKLFKNTTSFSVDGKQSTSIRNQILNEFKTSEKAIISNARCLTEGVDVPTIDLVYFSDPKNSKIDIIQAVGRALRKKEGKKLGYIVIPVYHLDNKEIEHSISQGSFKNLIQVIRSLCEQDERLQDEINKIAFGKGIRGSKKIDIISSFSEESEQLQLIGFEDDLRKSLFSQIINKTSNNWDIWFLELKNHLETHNNYPTIAENKDLNIWCSRQRRLNNKGLLKNDEIRKLDSINFAWDISGFKLEKLYEELVLWRKNYPNKWPQYDRQKTDSLESKLNVSCSSLRKKFNQNDLSDYWFDKFTLIDFNFDARLYAWEIKFESIKSIVKKYDSFEAKKIGRLNRLWLLRLHQMNLDGKLPEYQSKKMLELDLYFAEKILLVKKSWEERYNELKEWIINNETTPTKAQNKLLYSWFCSQRTSYQRGTLSKKKIKLFSSINVSLDKINIEKIRKENWMVFYEDLVKFINKNSSNWPQFKSKGKEKKLYNWIQANRSAYTGKSQGGRRKKLKQWKIEKLEDIGMIWNSKTEEVSFEDRLVDYIKIKNGEFKIITDTDKKLKRSVMIWYYEQKRQFKHNILSTNKISIIKNTNVSLEEIFNHIDTRNGYSKWANAVEKIADFIKKNGHYPKAGKDKEQANLYGSLNRTKRKFKKNEFSEKQISLLKELNILLS